MNNKLQNGCFGNYGHEQCLAMGCIPNSGIHTFTETCAEGNAPCPYPYHLESNGGSISFNCPDQLAEDHCVATFGPDFPGMSPCLELGCVLTDDSTYEEWCVSPEEVGTGSVCPSDCYLQNHIVAINFICPDQETEDMCTATFGPNFTLDECLHLGCHLSEDSTYEEWCEGGSCGYPNGNGNGGTGTDGGAVPVPGPDGCPPGFELHQSGNMIMFNCPDNDSEIQCISTYGPDFTMYTCLSLGCILDSSSDWQEWCKPSNYSPTTDASYTVPYTGTDVPYSRTESTTDAPTDSWEPLPFCPEWSEYKFDGQVDAIDWQCPSDAAHQWCNEYIATIPLGNLYGPQNAFHDCFMHGSDIFDTLN